MKAEIISAFDFGLVSLTVKTALFARKVNGVWLVHLNYHRVTACYTPEAPNSHRTMSMLEGKGITLQTSRDSDAVAVFCMILGTYGLGSTVVTSIRKLLEVLANVSSLVPTLLSWVSDEIENAMKGEESVYWTLLKDVQFVLELIQNGSRIERRLPKWREKTIDR